MGYEAITDAEIAVGKPVTNPLMDKVKDNFEYLYGKSSQAGISPINGSFETDTDEDGVPDNWTRTLYSGGSGGLETGSPAHGAQACKFIHPGGAGNGGGYLDSDYIEVSQLQEMALYYITWATAAGMKNQIRIRYYTAAKAYISDTALYDSTTNPTSPTLYCSRFTSPSTARYCKIRVIGGYTDTDVAGTAYFDGLWLVPSNVTISIPDAAITTAKLKTVANTTGASGNVLDANSVVIAMQDYCYFPNIYVASRQHVHVAGHSSSNADTTARLGLYSSNGVRAYHIRWRYVTASDKPFLYAVRDKITGEILCLWACDDPPPEYWGLDAKPENWNPPIAAGGGLPVNTEEIILFNQNHDFMLELGEKAQKDKKLPFQVLSENFEYDNKSRIFKARQLAVI